MTEPRRGVSLSDGTIVLCFVAALIAVRVLGSLILPVFDDAFITFRYARNLAAGNGFLYNPGEWVLGTTSPAFGLITSIFFLAGLPVPDAVVVLNIACDAALLVSAMRLLAKESGREAAWIFGGLFIASPIFTRIAVGGMEVNLFLLLGFVAVRLYHGGREYAAVTLAAVCYFLRPESAMLVAIFCITELVTGRRGRALGMAALALACVLPGLALIHVTYGSIIPQSVAAKSLIPPQPHVAIFRQLLAPDPLSLVVLPFAIHGAVMAVRRGGILRTIVWWGGSYLVAYGLARPMVWLWYGVATYFAVLLLAAPALYSALGRFRAAGRLLSPRLLPTLMVALPLLVWIGIALVRGRDDATFRVYEPLQRWCREGRIPASARIAAYDVGAIGYYADTYIYDLAGLVWPEAARRRFDYAEIVARYKPEYLYLSATKETAEWTGRPEIRRLYAPIARFSKFGLTGLEVDTALLRSEWVQDYFLFKRRDVPSVRDTTEKAGSPEGRVGRSPSLVRSAGSSKERPPAGHIDRKLPVRCNSPSSSSTITSAICC